MAGQRTQLTVERVRKKGPGLARIVGFCSLPKFAPTSELLLQMDLSEWKRAGRGGREADDGFMVCAAKMFICDIIIGLVLKCTFLKHLVKQCPFIDFILVFLPVF